MLGDGDSLLARALPVIGIAYLLYLTTLAPPVKWMGWLCLAILTPVVILWALGRVGVGPLADQ